MKKYTLALMKLTIFLLPLITVCCHRQPLEDEYYEHVKVPVSINWTKSDLTPQNVTVLFYNETDGKLALEHRFENNPNEIQSYADVPYGKYTVVVFNELRDQIDYVGVRGYETLNTLEFYAKTDPEVKQVKSSTSTSNATTYVKEPDIVAISVVRGFEVKANTNTTPRQLIGLTPERKVGYMDITIHIKGLNNARMPALVDLRNIAGSYFVDTDKNSTTPVACQFMMNNRTYDPESSTDGTISTKVKVFGVLGDRTTVADQPTGHPIALDISLMLVDADKTIINHVVDITDMLTFTGEVNGSISLETELPIPAPLPDVKPEGGDSGFGSDLTDWGIIDVPLVSH